MYLKCENVRHLSDLGVVTTAHLYNDVNTTANPYTKILTRTPSNTEYLMYDQQQKSINTIKLSKQQYDSI